MPRKVSASAKRDVAVAASGRGADPEDGTGLPAGEVHGWWHGQGETTCGLSMSRSQLVRFPALRWVDVQPESGGHADLVQVVCPRCAAALGPAGPTTWHRTSPRP